MPLAAPAWIPPLRSGDRLTRDEFLRRWEAMPDVKWAELIDGVVSMPSPISDIHGDYHFRMSAWLTHYVTATPGCAARPAGTWLMSGENAPQPDLALRILEEHGGQSRMNGPYPQGAPELAIEVSHSTGARDSGAKLRLYERNGVREYLIVRPKSQGLVWRVLNEAGRYEELDREADGWYRSRVFPGLWLNPEALWLGDLPALAAAVAKGVKSKEHAAFAARLTRRKR